MKSSFKKHFFRRLVFTVLILGVANITMADTSSSALLKVVTDGFNKVINLLHNSAEATITKIEAQSTQLSQVTNNATQQTNNYVQTLQTSPLNTSEPYQFNSQDLNNAFVPTNNNSSEAFVSDVLSPNLLSAPPKPVYSPNDVTAVKNMTDALNNAAETSSIQITPEMVNNATKNNDANAQALIAFLYTTKLSQQVANNALLANATPYLPVPVKDGDPTSIMQAQNDLNGQINATDTVNDIFKNWPLLGPLYQKAAQAVNDLDQLTQTVSIMRQMSLIQTMTLEMTRQEAMLLAKNILLKSYETQKQPEPVKPHTPTEG